MDEDTKTEEVIQGRAMARGHLDAVRNQVMRTTLDMSHATSAELLADRDHWERQARELDAEALHWKSRAEAEGEGAAKLRTEVAEAYASRAMSAEVAAELRQRLAAETVNVAGWRAEYDRAAAKLAECVTRDYMEAQLGDLRESLERRRAELLRAETALSRTRIELAQAKRDVAAQGIALDGARLAEQRWCTEAKRLHDLVEGLQEAANAGADRSRLEVAQHTVGLLAQRETSTRLMRALFELAVSEREEHAARKAKARWRTIAATSPTPDFLDRQAGDAAALAGDPEAGS